MAERKLAMFDFDKTIYNKHSLFGVIKYYEEKRIFRLGVMNKVQEVADRFDPKEGKFRNTANEIIQIMANELIGSSYKEVIDITNEFFVLNKDNFYSYFEKILPVLKKVYDVWLVTQGSQMVGEAICEKFKLTGYLSTEFEVENGVFTGKIKSSFANGKMAAKSLVEKYGKTGSMAFGDSENDVQMLELVEIPICINPNEELMIVAKERNWTVVNHENAAETVLGLLK